MPVSPAEPMPPSALPRSRGNVAVSRALVAVLWAIAYFLALHGQKVLTGSGMPAPAGLLLAAYPLIDAVASVSGWRSGRADRAGLVIDCLAVVGLLTATLGFRARWVLVAFGAWALASGLLQLIRAWHADGPRRVQLPLILSGTISAAAGVAFAAMASQHVAPLSDLGGYAVLGAVFFLVSFFVSAFADRGSIRPGGPLEDEAAGPWSAIWTRESP